MNLVRQNMVFEMVMEDHNGVKGERAADQSAHDEMNGLKCRSLYGLAAMTPEQ
jgi:hypothetical protein